jgi:hypothetical protein
MPAGRMIKRSNQLGEIEHPVYRVALAEPRHASEVLKNVRVVDGRAPPAHRPDIRGTERQAWPAAGTVRSDACPSPERPVLI